MLGVLKGTGFRGAVAWMALVALCAAYVQGGIDKVLDFRGAIAETAALGIPLPGLATVATIVTELVGSAMVIANRWRWLGALWLAGFTGVANMLANAWWAMPQGPGRFGAMNGFFEHIGLIGAFVFVALNCMREERDRS